MLPPSPSGSTTAISIPSPTLKPFLPSNSNSHPDSAASAIAFGLDDNPLRPLPNSNSPASTFLPQQLQQPSRRLQQLRLPLPSSTPAVQKDRRYIPAGVNEGRGSRSCWSRRDGCWSCWGGKVDAGLLELGTGQRGLSSSPNATAEAAGSGWLLELLGRKGFRVGEGMEMAVVEPDGDGGSKDAGVAREESHSGSTPLHLAAHGGSLDCVRTLLAWGADQLQRDSSGRIPYSVAIKHNHGACAALLNPLAAEPLVWPSPLKFISELDPDARALLEVALMDANKESEKIILNERKKLLSPANVDEAFHDDASEGLVKQFAQGHNSSIYWLSEPIMISEFINKFLVW
ncbi:hypothetical protein ZIOFF_036485 [Zingiber officinale]|uniref:Uncharacterized protein n=1 Tax=Zingiber officinale TaxID=94328 RepID=A0A8J5GI91_ZINOF|nr:hypothetical protein ZIOFF_036485 [Zingiber officinale]